MKDDRLVDINFREIVDYGGQPRVENDYSTPLDCHGYCTNCEESGLLEGTSAYLDQMSHGADTSDYEQLLGPLPRTDRSIDTPILFLLENPGGDHGNGKIFPYKGFTKRPPLNHYYWTPNVSTWPTSTGALPNHYGPYFAYLMRRFSMHNVYITNVVKCDWQPRRVLGLDTSRIVQNCISRFLIKELSFFMPGVAFCFGRKAERWLQRCVGQTTQLFKVVYLFHPAAITSAARYRRTSQEMFEKNDDRVSSAIEGLGL